MGPGPRDSAGYLVCRADRLYSTGCVPVPSCSKTQWARFTFRACALYRGLVDPVVRHPMYAGFIPMVVGPALWLESYAAALLAIVPIVVLAVRSVFEERFLKRELKGYDAYTEKVRYRLIPIVW